MLSMPVGLAFAALMSVGASAQDTLKLGMLSILTGPGASQGLAGEGGAQIAVDDVNAAGGLKIGDKTYQVQLISYDEQNKADVTLDAYDRLTDQDGVKFIIGPMSGVGALAIKSDVNSDKIPIFVSAWSKKVFDKDDPYAYRVVSTSNELAQPLVDWVKTNLPSIKRVAIVNQNDETGWDAAPVIHAAYAKDGFDVVNDELFERTVSDFQPMLTKILANKPDLIDLATSAPTTAGLIVRQARDLGYTGRFMKIGGPGARDIVAGAGKADAEGLDMWLMADPTNPGYQRLAKIFESRNNGQLPDDQIIPFYDATKMLLAAMEKAGTVDDPDAVMAAMGQLGPFPSVMGGKLTLGGEQTYGIAHQILRPNYVGEIRNGQSVIVGTVN